MSLRKKIQIAAGIVCLGLALLPVLRHYQLRSAVQAYVAELKARGEPMDLAQVIPPPTPPDQNGAPAFLEAFSLLHQSHDVLYSNSPSPMHMVAPGKALVCWRQPEVRSKEGVNSWEEVRMALEVDAEGLEALAQITNKSALDFDLQYSQRFEMLLTHLSKEKQSAQTLSYAALSDLHFGDTPAAVEKIHVMLALVNETHNERTAISQLVRIAIAQIATATTWELLQSPDLTDQQLAALQGDWSQLEFIDMAEKVLPVEREGAETTVAKWRGSDAELQRFFATFNPIGQASQPVGLLEQTTAMLDNSKFGLRVFFWRNWSSYSDELRALKGYDALIEATRSIEGGASFRRALAAKDVALDHLGISKLRDSFDTLFSGETDFRSVISGSIVSLGNFLQKVLRVEAARRIVLTAIALQRSRLKNGKYPETLNPLAPEFFPSVPLDPVDAQPLRYRLNPDGTFLLYSIAENGVDDGGNASPRPGATVHNSSWLSSDALDWVWPQPAADDASPSSELTPRR